YSTRLKHLNGKPRTLSEAFSFKPFLSLRKDIADKGISSNACCGIFCSCLHFANAICKMCG
ncbi:hypothetical protein QTO16_22920, partial [Vibrio harveyi]|uniref:hypothetical protein n=1 Tax=Vibrio harveyi TaxID=669 RepID=UPI002F42D80D